MYNNTFSPPLLIESWLECVSNTSSNTFPIQTINRSVLGEQKCYGSGRAVELPEGAAAGVRVRALGHSSRVRGSVTEGG